eukprot:12921246-Prorocentrum_lima.AAC.1
MVASPTAEDDGDAYDEGELREAIRKASMSLTPIKPLPSTQSHSTPPPPTQPTEHGADGGGSDDTEEESSASETFR